MDGRFDGYLAERTDHHAGSATARELEVALYVSHGMTTRMIAGQLSISEHTVKSHVASLRLKYNAKTRAHLIAILVRAGLI